MKAREGLCLLLVFVIFIVIVNTIALPYLCPGWAREIFPGNIKRLRSEAPFLRAEGAQNKAGAGARRKQR